MIQRDGLKPLEELCQVDERNLYHLRVNRLTLGIQPNTLEAHYSEIQSLELNAHVPDLIATQYDVARNIYIYAWFEYRFFNVSEANALITLELALKNRIGESEILRYINERKQQAKLKKEKNNPRQGLKTLMEYCRDYQLICNQGFSAWRRYPELKAMHEDDQRMNALAIAEIQKKGISTVAVEPYVPKGLPPDEDYNHVQFLIDNVNHLRNGYAHGSINLYADVLLTFEMVSEFINQLYPVPTQTCIRSDLN